MTLDHSRIEAHGRGSPRRAGRRGPRPARAPARGARRLRGCRAIEDGFAETAGRLGCALAAAGRRLDRRRDRGRPHDRLAAGPRTSWRVAESGRAAAGVQLAPLRPSSPCCSSPSRPCDRRPRASRRPRPPSASSRSARRRNARDGLHARAARRRVLGRDLPDPGPDMVYEIWMIEGEEATPGGCVSRPTARSPCRSTRTSARPRRWP